KTRTQERSRNSEPSLLHSARSQSTANGSKPMPRTNNQTSRIWPATKNSFVTTKSVPIAEHPRSSRNDSCVTKFLKEVNSRAKVPSNKTTNNNKLVEQNGVPHKHERQIPTGHRFSIQKTSIVQKKTMTPRSCLRWKPAGKIFKTVGLRWVLTGKIFTSSTTKVDSEPLNGSNADITNQYECERTLNLSEGTSFNLKVEGLRVCSELRFHDHSNEQSSSKLVLDDIPPADKIVITRQALELLFHHHICMLRSTCKVSETSIANNTSGLIPQRQKASDYDNLDLVPQRQDVYSSVDADSTSAPSTHTNVHAEENNNDQAEEGEHVPDDEFTNPFCAPAQEEAESSSHNIGQSIGTPIATKPKLDADLNGNLVDQTDYRSKIGSLMYLTSSRPDIVQAGSSFELAAFSDADHAGCIDTRKSTSGGIQFLGDKLVSWMSKKQNCTAMSLAEAEYVALSASCAQVMWMRTQLQDYGFNYNKIPLYCDSQSAIAISYNPVQQSRTKHIHTRYHFIKEQVENEVQRGVVIQDTPSAPKPKLATSELKLKGVQSLTLKEQNATEIMQALKESEKTNQRLPEKKDNNRDVDDEDEDDDHISDIQDTNDGDVETEYDEHEIYKYKIQVHKDVDTTEEKGDGELAGNAMTSKYQVKVSIEFPLPSSILSVSSGCKIQKPTIDLVPEYEKSPLEIHKIKKELAKKQKMLRYTIKSTDKATLIEYDLKSSLYQKMNENKSFNKNLVNHALYHALMQALIEDENPMDKGGKKIKRRRTKESKSSMKPSTTKETSKGKALSKSSKTSKSVTTKKPIEELIAEVVMNDQEINTNEDVVNDADRPQHGTCTSSIKLEYNIAKFFKLLTDKLDWNNPEGDHCPFDLTKPVPLKGRPCHLTVAAEYFFNNDLEFLKSSDSEKNYTMSIIKTKIARCEIAGIEDMVLTLWSPIKYGYDKDAKKGIKH
nr:copia protein [Tanacetum cinerariifolium]